MAGSLMGAGFFCLKDGRTKLLQRKELLLYFEL